MFSISTLFITKILHEREDICHLAYIETYKDFAVLIIFAENHMMPMGERVVEIIKWLIRQSIDFDIIVEDGLAIIKLFDKYGIKYRTVKHYYKDATFFT